MTLSACNACAHLESFSQCFGATDDGVMQSGQLCRVQYKMSLQWVRRGTCIWMTVNSAAGLSSIRVGVFGSAGKAGV